VAWHAYGADRLNGSASSFQQLFRSSAYVEHWLQLAIPFRVDSYAIHRYARATPRCAARGIGQVALASFGNGQLDSQVLEHGVGNADYLSEFLEIDWR